MNRLLPLLFLWPSLIFAQSAPNGVSLTFTTIAVPGAGYTNAWGINSAGEIVGSYGKIDNGFDGHGFVYSNGTYTTFDYPGAYRTLPSGINDSGLIVGTVEFQGGLVAEGFFYDGKTFTLFEDSGQQTYVDGVNNAGYVVGGDGEGGGQINAFELYDGQFTTIKIPGQYLDKAASAINNLGEIVGFAADGNANSPDVGIVYQNGKLRKLSVPGSLQTETYGVNDDGLIVGVYFLLGKGDFAFAYRNGAFLSFTYPGAIDTGAVSINNSRQVVGQCTLPDYSTLSFVTSPITDADFR